MHPPRPPVRRPVAAALFFLLAIGGALVGCAGGDREEVAAPAKVTVAGDSISVGLGAELRAALPSSDVKVIGAEGTGLARADVFDWPARLRRLAAEFPPSVLVLSLGSNDAQDLLAPSGSVVASLSSAEAWDVEYRARLAAAFDAFEGSATTVVWVGHVRTGEDRVGLVNRRIHRLAEQVAASRDWVVVEDLAAILGSDERVAADCLVADGLHLRRDCLQRAAEHLARTLPT